VGTSVWAIWFLMYATLGTILAGSLPMGEERMSGTHSWSMALPVSVRRQWLIKLSVSLVSGVLCVSLVMTAASVLLGGSFAKAFVDFFGRDFILIQWFSAILTFAAFWCACAIKGTVRAILCVIPVCGAVAAAFGLGISTNDFLLRAGIWDFIISIVHPYPFANGMTSRVVQLFYGRHMEAWWLATPLSFFTLFQTQRMFRREASDRVIPLIRYLLVPFTVAFVIAFVQAVPGYLIFRTTSQARAVLTEINTAVTGLQPDPAKMNVNSPIQYSLADLTRNAAISSDARRWLQDATFSVTPKEVTYRVWRNRQWETESFPYLITVHLQHNWDCSVSGPDSAYYSCRTASDSWGYVPLEDLIKQRRGR
jgi:hypothetical protein